MSKITAMTHMFYKPNLWWPRCAERTAYSKHFANRKTTSALTENTNAITNL